jgi:hypothetical protein
LICIRLSNSWLFTIAIMAIPLLTAAESGTRYIINPSKVQESLAILQQLGAHQTLPGYLCVQRTAAREQRLDHLHPQFKSFFDEFLAPSGAPPKRPYLNPFVAADGNMWLNSNVAGSYAPSSLREVSPLRRVLTMADNAYHLRPQHWQLAKEALLYGRHISALALATFLYRDRGIVAVAPTPQQLIEAFQGEFGYLDEGGAPTEAYQHLYRGYELEEFNSAAWFVPFLSAPPIP